MTELRLFGLSSLAVFWAGFSKQTSVPAGDPGDLNAYMLRDINLTPSERAAFTYKTRDMLSPAYRYRLP
ncbi:MULTISPECIES: hypothetical protein [Phyllobacterium]|uniref:hypothetical protein n=1 Tax=Phyllobacterium TaxID=28100 RepID=UPI000E0F432A